MFDIQLTTETGRVPVTIARISGDIDSATSKLLQDRLMGAIHSGARHIVVDLARVPYMSSAGLRVLHEVFNQLRKANNEIDDDGLRKKMREGGYKSPHLKVANLSEQVRLGFETAGFDVYIEAFDDVKTAIERCELACCPQKTACSNRLHDRPV